MDLSRAGSLCLSGGELVCPSASYTRPRKPLGYVGPGAAGPVACPRFRRVNWSADPVSPGAFLFTRIHNPATGARNPVLDRSPQARRSVPFHVSAWNTAGVCATSVVPVRPAALGVSESGSAAYQHGSTLAQR